MRQYLTVLLAVSLLLGACAAPQSPPSYFKLTAIAAPDPALAGPSVGIRPVKVPEYLRRSAVVREGDKHQLMVSGTERWAEPLEDGLQRVLTLNLAALLPTNDIRQFPWTAADQPEIVVELRVLDLTASAGRATMVAEAALTQSGSAPRHRLLTLARDLPESPSGQSIAETFSALVHDLSVELVDLLNPQVAEPQLPTAE